MPEEGGLASLLEALRRQWRIALLVALPVMAGAVLYTETLPSQYDATAVVSFGPRPDQELSADVIRLLLSKYDVVAQSDATVRAVATEIDMDEASLKGGLDVATPTDTANLEITVRSRSSEEASDAANAVADAVAAASDDDLLVVGTVVSEAFEPTGPAAPPRRLLELASLVAASLLGVGAAVVLEWMRPRVRSAVEIAYETSYRVVGRIPSARIVRSAGVDALGDLVVGAGVRALRTALALESRTDGVRIVVVTSALAGEGKTTVASLLAASVARLDTRVLLVDGDLIRPKVARQFNITPVPGLREVLRHVERPDAAIRTNVIPHLSVLPSRADPAAGDLLARDFVRLIGETGHRYDIIMIDAPPILGSDISRILVSLADGVLLVVAAGTPTTAVRDAAAALNELNDQVLGVVANRLDDADAYLRYYDVEGD